MMQIQSNRALSKPIGGFSVFNNYRKVTKNCNYMIISYYAPDITFKSVGVQDPERRLFACKQSTLRDFLSGTERVSSLSCVLNGLIEKQELTRVPSVMIEVATSINTDRGRRLDKFLTKLTKKTL